MQNKQKSLTLSEVRLFCFKSLSSWEYLSQGECDGKKSNCLTAEASPVGWGWQSIAFVCWGSFSSYIIYQQVVITEAFIH